MPKACLEATLTLVKFYEINNISINTDIIKRQVMSWYTNSDVVDPEMLAAAVLSWGSWRYVDYSDWIEAVDRWFPQPPIYFHVNK